MASRPTLCAICFVDPKTGQRGTNATTRICDSCKRDTINGVRVNEDWIEDDSRLESAGREDDVAADAKTNWSISLQELAECPIRTETELQVAIIDVFACGLVVDLPYFDTQGRRRGSRPASSSSPNKT
jgi:hypothetical protein